MPIFIYAYIYIYGHAISVVDCAKTEYLYCLFFAVPGPGTVPGHRTTKNRQYRFLVLAQSTTEMRSKIAV